jgi:hypothetical protein
LDEKWAWIPGYEGRYEASDHGRIKSHCRSVPLIMHQRVSNMGYFMVMFSGKNLTVHRLVMRAFNGDSALVVRHLDGNQKNNALSNLKYGTYSENAHDRVAHGNMAAANKTHCIRGHEFTPENTRLWHGLRNCRACARLRGPANVIAARERRERLRREAIK